MSQAQARLCRFQFGLSKSIPCAFGFGVLPFFGCLETGLICKGFLCLQL